MRKLYSIALFSFLGLSLQAQLTQSNHAPAANDTYKTYQCDSLNINPGSAGAGVTWNFSAVSTRSSIVSNYTANAITNATYPSANIAVASSTGNISYYSSSATVLNYWGGNITIGPVSAALTYTSASVYASYPMSLNTTSSAAVAGSINVLSPAAASGAFSGNCNVIADGTGTLILPGINATFTNAMRVVTSQTLTIPSILSSTLTQITYNYYSIGTKAPLYTISTATFASIFGAPSTQILVTRNAAAVATPSDVSVKETALSEAKVVAYPNPATNIVNFVSGFNNSNYVSLFDVTGKEIERVYFNDSKIKLDVSKYARGLYMYKAVNSNDKTIATGKITVAD